MDQITEALVNLAAQFDAATSEEEKQEILSKLALLPRDLRDEKYKESLAAQARELSPRGFLAYSELINGTPVPKHNRDAVEDVFRAHEEGVPFLYRGFRGCRKTTTFSKDFDCWLIGHHPEGTGLVVGASDPNPEMITKSMAAIIEFHPDWKRVFPNVVPDRTGDGKGWSVSGYWVIDTSLDPDSARNRELWTQRQAKVIDPTFVGGGYASSRINGRHPSLFLTTDDLHDIDSSSSSVERERIKTTYFGQIEKTALRLGDKLITWVMLMGVPFAPDDTYQTIHNSGYCVSKILPCMTKAPENAPGAVYIDGLNKKNGTLYEDIKGWWFLTWDEFGVETIIAQRSEGKSLFWQMHMMDLVMSHSGGLKYYSMPFTVQEAVDKRLPVQGGADVPYVEHVRGDIGKSSAFALAYIAKLPQGGACVVDGVIERPSSLVKGATHMAKAQTMFPGWIDTASEDVGGGSVFIQGVNAINPNIRIHGSSLKAISGMTKVKGIKNKSDRINLELAKWFENMRIRISEANTPFLNALRYGLDNFFDLDEHNPSWDALDAVYHAAKAMPDVLQVPLIQSTLPNTVREMASHPLLGISKHKGY